MQIPLGNFGNVIPAAAPRVNIPAGAFDTTSGIKELADTGMRVAGDSLSHQKQEADKKAIEQQREKEALDRATAANAALDREISIKTINQEVEQRLNDGSLKPAEAEKEYRTRVESLGTPDVTGYDPVTAMNLQRAVKRMDFSGQSSVAVSVGKAQKNDLRTQTDAILDKLGKQSSLPGADPNKLAAQINGLDDIGTRAYGPTWGKRKQDWIDNNWDAHINQQAMNVRDDMDGIKALAHEITAGKYADKLDSNKRNSMVAKLEAYKTSLIQRQEAAASRADRESARRLREAEAEFNTFQTMADKGTILNPEYIDRATKLTEGTPYQAAIVSMAKEAAETGGIAAQPLAAQQAMLDAVDAKIATQGRSPELDKRREQISKVLNGSQSDLKSDGLRAGLERGVIASLDPLDMSSPQGFAESIGARLKQAETVSMWAGRTVSPIDSQEAEKLRTMLDTLAPKAKSQAIATLAESVGPRAAGAIAQQLDSQDKALALAFASSGTQTTAGRYTSELILKGAAALKDGTVMKDDKKVTGWKATIAGQIDGAFPDARAAGAVKDAAYYIAAGIAQENGGSLSNSEIERSVRLAVGGDIIERRGKKLPIPSDMDADDFEDKLRNVSVNDLLKQAPSGTVKAGGVDMPVAGLKLSLPGQELIYAGYGQYAVVVRGRPVVNEQGRPVIIRIK